MLDEIIAGKLIKASATIGFWPCNSTEDDDIVLFSDESRSESIGTF